VKNIMAKSNLSHDPMATGNAAAATTAVVFVACRLLVGVFPNFMFVIGQSWLHGVQLTKMSTWNVPTSAFLLGIISSTFFAWVVGYVFALFYNKFAER